jgi:hypothetical protein
MNEMSVTVKGFFDQGFDINNLHCILPALAIHSTKNKLSLISPAKTDL